MIRARLWREDCADVGNGDIGRRPDSIGPDCIGPGFALGFLAMTVLVFQEGKLRLPF